MHQYRVLSSFNIIRLRGGLGPPLRATREPCENIMTCEANERPSERRLRSQLPSCTGRTWLLAFENIGEMLSKASMRNILKTYSKSS